MSRNLYIPGGVLLVFTGVSFAMSMVASRTQPMLPANGTLWRTSALVASWRLARMDSMVALREE